MSGSPSSSVDPVPLRCTVVPTNTVCAAPAFAIGSLIRGVNVIVRVWEVLFPATSVAVTGMLFGPLTRPTEQENVPVCIVAACPEHTTVATPEVASVTVPLIVSVRLLTVALFAGEVMDSVGAVLSSFTGTETETVEPLASVAVPEMVCIPSLITNCEGGHCTGATPPEQTKLTVTSLVFQPDALGAGDRVAAIANDTTVNVAGLLVPAPGTVTVTEAGPSGSPDGTVTWIAVLFHGPTVVAVIPLNLTVLVP